ncbi:inorganic phosphate transporter [Nocardioides marmoribigeumensis]|uniref:Phosphate transporter n=1 Tax=Nocardioides marmoribigeumensis TaxID=433649 RepID=A0ABU2BTU7_9ACTN|nr:inorganic phosphate transporter [Nocardioides marmoribigeumensis]MDR7362045.1 PiT family inorganic phosphate transporter [Nocardioides marmoribigeumensis]
MDLAIIIAVVAVALAFDYTNGFHDAANAIATSVSTRALTPRAALAMAAVMNFIGAFLGQEVANTVGKVITLPQNTHGLTVVMAGLLGAIAWNLLTWYFGLPSSSSHALIGGLMGAGMAFALATPGEFFTGVAGSEMTDAGCTVGGKLVDGAQCGVVRWQVILDKIVIPMIASPIVGFLAAALVMIAIMWIWRKANPSRTNRGFRLAQTVSAAAMALGHGLQDAQKTMGVIFLALLTGGHVSADDSLPVWVIIAAASAISLGTYSGGWRIMRTLGRRIIHLDPPRGFAAESVSAGVLYTTAFVFEAPISTTHIITSAVMGVGATKRVSAVRWGVAKNIVGAWIFTFPAAGLMAAICYFLLRLLQLP